MNISTLLKQKGIGLIEVLIALLVVSLGLLALASFQGSLLKSSGNNKARAEAIDIAQQELELIRYAATRSDDFLLVPTNPAAKTVAGTNASFTVTSVAEDPTTNSIINVVVRVAWTDAAGDPDNVTLMSEVGLQDIQKSAFATNDSASSVAVPSPRQRASEDVRPASEIIGEDQVSSPTPTPLPLTANASDGEGGLLSSFDVTGNDGVDYTLRQIAPGSRYYNTVFSNGVLAVYVCRGDGSNCTYIQNHFGGKTLSTSGIIYSINPGNNLSDVNVVWSSSEVTACYERPLNTITRNGVTIYRKEYECVYAGNCNNNEASCQSGVTVNQVNARNVGPGGEFGNLGLIGLRDSNPRRDQLCFLEDTAILAENPLSGINDLKNPKPQYNESYLFAGTTRLYVTRQLMSNGVERSEGINSSYRNHNFLVVQRPSNDVYTGCKTAAVTNNYDLFQLAPKEVIRINPSNTNFVPNQPKVFNGVMPAVALSYSSPVSMNKILKVYLSEDGSCYAKKDGPNYACVLPQNVANASVYAAETGFDGSAPEPTPISYQSCPIVSTSVTFDAFGNEQSVKSYNQCNWSGDFN